VLNDDYYSNSRKELFVLLPANLHAENALDVGCGAGAAGRYLKDNYAVENVVGLEKVPEIAAKAEGQLDRVIVMDAESPDLPFQPDQFDLIVMADVLEHMVDPWKALERYRVFVKPGGLMLLSIPNIQHWRTVSSLLLGQWNYTESGILDRTHLRFFTRKSVMDLIASARCRVVRVKANMGAKGKVVNFFTLGILKNFVTFHFFILLRKEDEVM
jgi:SAM-dependent methyltransferase